MWHDMIRIVNTEQFKFYSKMADLSDSLPLIEWYVVRVLKLAINFVALI
jgi:hypothetical protein